MFEQKILVEVLNYLIVWPVLHAWLLCRLGFQFQANSLNKFERQFAKLLCNKTIVFTIFD